MTFRTRRWFPALLALSLGAGALAACGGDEEPAAEGTTTTTAGAQDTQAADPFMELKEAADHVGPGGSSEALATGIAKAAEMDGDVASKASQTYAELSGLLQEHVYLAGIAVDVGLGMGLDSPTFKAAADTLDKNSVALSELIGSVAGADNEKAFLELWRQHIGFFVDYAKAAAGNDDPGRQQALQNLDQYRSQAGAFFEKITGGAVPASAVEQELMGHVGTLSAAIDAAAAGDTTVFAKLKVASDHVGAGGSSKALATGIAKAVEMDGSVDSQAAQTYAQLSNLLEEHVYLAGIAVKTGYTAGIDSPAFTAAADTLDTNSIALSMLIGSVAGPENEKAFLELWRQHIGFFVDYAKAAAAGDEAGKEQAVDSLDQYRSQAGAFFDKITDGAVPASAVEEELMGHVETLTEAIDALAAALATG